MKVCVIASGSKGNMTYVESGNTKILIDAGISLINASKRVNSINFNEITDVLITHEHIDHIGFLASVLKKTNANLYISKKCFMSLRNNCLLCMLFKTETELANSFNICKNACKKN